MRARAVDLFAQRIYICIINYNIELIVSGTMCVHYAFSAQTGRSSGMGFFDDACNVRAAVGN